MWAKNVDPRMVPEETVEQMLTRAKSCDTAWKGMEFKCKGPYIMPIAADVSRFTRLAL